MNLYIAQTINQVTGEMMGTEPMERLGDAVAWSLEFLVGQAGMTARVWEHPQVPSNKGGVLNRVVWDSRFPNGEGLAIAHLLPTADALSY